MNLIMESVSKHSQAAERRTIQTEQREAEREREGQRQAEREAEWKREGQHQAEVDPGERPDPRERREPPQPFSGPSR
jgi:hypothetical protein